ncbi:hypothetical protein MCEZE4_00321 [Burkholderiaceae bacterium]|jgi:hypothetical protein
MNSKLANFNPLKARSLLLSSLVALVIVGAQWLGFYHNIEHAGLNKQTQYLSELFKHPSHLHSADSEQAKSTCDLTHSSAEHPDETKSECQLFDSLLLSACFTSPQFSIHAHLQAIAIPVTAFISLAKQITLWPYQSQAPPFITL